MGTILPDTSGPYMSVQIHGLTYRYKMVKDPSADATVYVRNEDAVNGGYVFEEVDDWDGIPGGTVQKYFRFPYIDSSRWGNGSMSVEGDGEIRDPFMVYNYRQVIDEELQKCYLTPLADPQCPGFDDALMNYLNSMEEPTADDPFYDEWVQANLSLDEEVETKEEIEVEEPEEEEANFEKRMGAESSIDEMVNTTEQASILAALAQVPKIEPYYIITIPGGEYNDVLQFESTDIPDNPRAMRSFATDTKHQSMVRSQYNKEQQE
jgi:hypothetical protein